MAKRHRLLVALLFELGAATEIDGLRRALGSAQLNRIPPHITLVPPVNLDDGAAEQAEASVRDVAARFPPFSLQLGPTAIFTDNPGVLYLRVGQSFPLDELRSALLLEIPAAHARDQRAFVPHVTLISRRSAFDSDLVVAELAHYLREVQIDAVSLMAQADGEPERPWKVVASYDLGASRMVGRGGLEISLHAGRGHPQSVRALLESWGASEGEPTGIDGGLFFAVAEVGALLVGVARWQRVGLTVELDSFIVAPGHRGVGVGTRLLDFVEDQARGQGARLLVAYVDPDGDLARYLVGRGFLQMGEVSVRGDARRGFGRALY